MLMTTVRSCKIFAGVLYSVQLQKIVQGENKMKNLKRMLALVVLVCALSVTAFAGDIHCGRTSEPTDTTESEVCGDISCGALRSIVTFVLSVV